MPDKRPEPARFIPSGTLPSEGGAVAPKNDGSGKETVLLVDDSSTIRSFLKQALEAVNFNVLQAEDGEKALDIFPTVPIDAILLDIEMPGLNGFQTCQKLRALPNGKYVSIIMLTALDDEDSINRSYEAGATDFITKPINWDLIAHHVRYVIRTGKHYADLIKSKEEVTKARLELEKTNAELEQRVADGMAELVKKNEELNNAMNSLKKAQSQMVTSEKMASVENLVSGISHEISMPVGASNSAISLLKEILHQIKPAFENNTLKYSDITNFIEKVGETISALEMNLQRITAMVASFKQVSMEQSTEHVHEFSLRNCLIEAIGSLKPIIENAHLAITFNCPDDLVVESYSDVISGLISTFVTNTINHAFSVDQAGEARINVTLEGEQVVLAYEDSGKGVAEKDINKLFEPFFSTKSGRGYVGLGLHTAYIRVTQILHGMIEYDPKPGGVARFVVRFPRAQHKNI